MDELKMVKLAELRSRISGIPVKLIVTFLVMAGMYWNFSMDKFKEDVPQNIFLFIVMYGILSYFWLCVKLTGNWIIGIVAAIVLIFLLAGNAEKLGSTLSAVITIAMCFGGPILDVLAVLRYFSLKRKLFSQTGDGYEYYEEYDEDDEDDEYEEEYDEEEEYGEAEEYEAHREYRKQAPPSPGFFSGCKDAASIKRRYRDLCKVYHPDSGNGSSEVFNRITEEYNRLMEGA